MVSLPYNPFLIEKMKATLPGEPSGFQKIVSQEIKRMEEKTFNVPIHPFSMDALLGSQIVENGRLGQVVADRKIGKIRRMRRAPKSEALHILAAIAKIGEMEENPLALEASARLEIPGLTPRTESNNWKSGARTIPYDGPPIRRGWNRLTTDEKDRRIKKFLESRRLMKKLEMAAGEVDDATNRLSTDEHSRNEETDGKRKKRKEEREKDSRVLRYDTVFPMKKVDLHWS